MTKSAVRMVGLSAFYLITSHVLSGCGVVQEAFLDFTMGPSESTEATQDAQRFSLTATEEALDALKAEATQIALQATTDASQESSPVGEGACSTEAECNNEGSHSYLVEHIEEGCFAGGEASAQFTIEFVEGGVNLQSGEGSPALYKKLDSGKYFIELSTGATNLVSFNPGGFSIVQTLGDGSSCLTYLYTRSD